MGAVISSDDFKNAVDSEVREYINNPNEIKMNKDQHELAKEFFQNSEKTCKVCKDVFHEYRNYEFDGEHESTLLPGDYILLFNKNDAMRNLSGDFKEMEREFVGTKDRTGFIHNARVPYIW